MPNSRKKGTSPSTRIPLSPEMSSEEALMEEMRTLQARWLAVVETIPGYLVILDENGTILSINRVAPGLTLERVIGTNIDAYVTPENALILKEKIKTVFQTGTVQTNVNTAVGANNTTAWYENRIGPVKRNDKVVAAVMIAYDITEHHLTEERLKNSQERLRILFQHAPDAYYLFDAQGVLVDGNKAAEDLTGYKKEELMGKNFLETSLLSEQQMPKALALFAQNAERKSTGPDEFTLTRKDASRVDVEIRTYPVHIKDEFMVLGIARDITKQKQFEKELDMCRAELEALQKAAKKSE